MARYFFHVTNGSTFKDEVGQDHPGLESAKAYAARIASDLNCKRLELQATWRTIGSMSALRVTDERGDEVAHVPIGRAAT